MADRQRVLLIEDNPGDVRLIREMLSDGEGELFQLDCVGRLSQGLEYLSTREAGVVLLDLSLPDSYGFDTFLKVYAHAPKVPIIVLTGHDDRTVALSAVKTGAQDYLVKGKLDRELLLRSMQYSIERKRYQVQLEHQANYDALTGLPNRNLLHDRLRQAVYSQRNPRAIAVVFMDLDHFKFVNDSLGHSTGDKLLKGMGERLRSVLREATRSAGSAATSSC
jgi:diguanylate cyclase